MRRYWKNIIAGFMTLIMLLGLLPTAAYAAVGELVRNSAVENAALLETLQEMYGDDAEAYLAVLEQYGLVDEDGNLVTDEKIVMDGVKYTLDEIEAVLNDPDTDLSTVVEVDGTYLTLEELKTIVEIEQYLAYLQTTYFTKQELTEEQIDSFYDLADAFANGGVQLMAATAEANRIGPSGVDHDITLTATGSNSASLNSTYTVTVTASDSTAAGYPPTFSWRAVSESVLVEGGAENVTLNPGESTTLTINVKGVDGTLNGTGNFLVQIYDVKNALIGGETRWQKGVSVNSSANFKYTATVNDTLSYNPDTASPAGYYLDKSGGSGGNAELKNKMSEAERASVTLSVPSDMSPGTYEKTLVISSGNSGTFGRSNAKTNGTTFWEDSKAGVQAWINIGTDESTAANEIKENNASSYTISVDGSAVKTGTITGFMTPQNWKQGGVDTFSVTTETKTITANSARVAVSASVMKYTSPMADALGNSTAWFIPRINIPVKLTVAETTTSTNVTLSTPDMTFYPGQVIPIKAKFDFPVKLDNLTLTINGKTATTPDKGTGDVCTFSYYVQDVDNAGAYLSTQSNANYITCTGANGRTGFRANITNTAGQAIGQAKIESPDKGEAFTDFKVEVKYDEGTNKPRLIATVTLSTNTSKTQWLNEQLQKGEVTDISVVHQFGSWGNATTFTVDPESTGSPKVLTAEIPLNYNTDGSPKTGKAELQWGQYITANPDVLMGTFRSFTVDPSIPVAKDDLTPKLTVTPAGSQGTDYGPSDTIPLIYAQQDNALALSFALASGKSYTWGDTSDVTYYGEDGQPVNKNAHFAWKSSDPTVAAVAVSSEGNATLAPTGKAGKVELTLTALNGGMDDAVTDPITVNFAVGQDPFLLIPSSGQVITIREGQDAVVNWTSNICQKNETAGEGGAFVPTTFTVSLYSGSQHTGTSAWTQTLTTTESDRILSSFTIPWESALKQLYDSNARSAVVTVSTQYGGATYGSYQDESQNWHDSATATIRMISQPASVSLAEPSGGLYQTDGGGGKNITLTWTVPHLDTTVSGGGQFELYIAGGGLSTPIVETTVGDEISESGGTYSYTLAVPAVELSSDPTSYRDRYSITVKAKNSAESTWASDSYVMYVYSDDALKLLLDGAEAGSSHTMSNVERIEGLWGDGGQDGSAAIVALQRDIALKNVISINYGQYAWAEYADVISWNSSDSGVATVNYQQGTLYENIENFSYTSYYPSTDFVLSGLKDGTTTVTATHVKTGITDTLTVDVETLRDQLYLFQCYPKTVTTLTYEVYTSDARTATEQMTLKTNENGEAAVYAPYGIAGNVYCQSELTESGEAVTYLGTIYNRNLVSSEADSTKLQLYPVNTLQLRRAAQAEIYLKNPDGTPYANQQVTFRGGVYREGEYCGLETVTFGLQNAVRSGWETGGVKQTVTTDANGRLLVTMDLSQFKSSANQKDVQAGEKLYYLFQLDYGNGSDTSHYPILLRVDASLNLNDVAATGDSIVTWEENDWSGAHTFIVSQTLKYSPSANANVADVRKSTGSIGPSSTFPNAYLTTTVMWWGDGNAKDTDRINSVMIQDDAGVTPAGQTSQIKAYPFTDAVFTENVWSMNEQVMTSWGVRPGESRGLRAAISTYADQISVSTPLPFKAVNMIGIEKAEDSAVLTDTLGDIKSNLNVDAGGSINGLGDDMIRDGLSSLAGDAKYDSSQDSFAVRLCATSDPTLFRAFFCLNVGNMESGGNVAGVYPDYADMEDMGFAQWDSAAKYGDADYFPNPLQMYKMAKGTYMDSVDEDGTKAENNQAVRSWNGDVGGYYEADIAYNPETKLWEIRPVSGGFHVGFGVNFSWFFNGIVGPVPVTMSITLGATLEVSMDMQRGNYWVIDGGANQVTGMSGYDSMSSSQIASAVKELNYSEGSGNDFLTKLRVFLYIKTFFGAGFDLSVVACKIGFFGQINADFSYAWLNRKYLNDSDKLSAVGPASSRKDVNMHGGDLYVSGSTGVEFLFKFLFASYEQVFCSVGFKLGDGVGDWDTIEEIWAANKKINNQPVTRMALPNGQVMYAMDLGARLEGRDYVDAVDQEWAGGWPGISLFALDTNQNSTLANALQTGAYSYANPVLSDDGAIMFYLSDRGTGVYDDAKDVTNTRVAVSTKSGEQFQEGVRFDTNSNNVSVGYGDSGVKVAGSNSGYAAVWVRQMEDFTPASGDGGTLDEGQQMLQMNSTEIIVATSSDGSSWTLKRLTSNSSPDLAPVVATCGTRTVVAWREVSSSAAGDLITSFDQQDAIRFVVYENGEWSNTQTLYDGTGTGASVKGIEAAMLSDGAAAVVYTLDTDAENNSNTDWETVLALIPNDDTSAHDSGEVKNEDTVRTFRLTTDSDLDENPQITTAKFDDDTERFVVAWHTERTVADSGETESDIRLAAMDADGVLYGSMPESIGRATDGTGETISSNFRFAKNAGSIEDLSILWVDSISADVDDAEYSTLSDAVAGGFGNMGRDVLKAVKFVENGGSFTVSGTVEVAEMCDNTLIDHFDAYMSDGAVKSVILGTNYSETTQRQVTISDGTTKTTANINVANPITGMYTATAEFTNRIDETAVMLKYDELYPNSDIYVQFTIRNSGKDAITALSITSDNGNATYYSTENDPLYSGDSTKLNLLPNRDITVTAKFPTGAVIENTEYVIKATFAENNQPVTLTDTLYLDIPDVGISKVTTVKEAGGERTLRYSLYNGLSAKLADTSDGWRVRVGFYADQGCTTPLKDADSQDLVMLINNEADLALIDAGGYSSTVTIPVGSYVDEDGEIPSTGIPVYVKAWIEAPVNGAVTRSVEYGNVGEYLGINNKTSLTLDNLAMRRNEDVTIQTSMDNSSGSTVATVEIQYNKLTGTTSGNLIATLLDENGNVLEQQQSYTGADGNNGLITLSEEEKSTVTFTFTKKGASVQISYSDLVLGNDNADLTSLIFSNIPGITLDSFVKDGDSETYRAAVSTDDLTTTTVMAAAKSGLAKVKITDDQAEGSNALSESVALNPGQVNTISITVTSGDSSKSKTYILTVQNNGEPVIQEPSYSEAQGETTYGTSVYYSADQSATINLTATALEQSRLSYQWYSCDAAGESATALADQTGTTLTVSTNRDVGVYYYKCKVTRALVNGGTKEYWSSVASVEVMKADGNSVTLTGTEVTFDNQPHGLTQAEASKTGSTLHYSTNYSVDGTTTWSETPPTFTAVGAHTVWVYATNPNYEDSKIVTATVTIMEYSNTLFKVETQNVSDVFENYPEAIKTKYTDAAGLETALKTEVTALGVPKDNAQVYDVKLLFSLDGGSTWAVATADNFPAAGVTVKLPYPEGTNRYGYNFTLLHLITNPLKTGKTLGDVETMDITLEEDGIRFTADCLSPFVLGWERRPSSPTNYSVAVRDADHGSVTVSPKRAEYGSTVTITVKPDEGYQVDEVLVTTSGGRDITFKQKDDTTYAFTMPRSAVSVKVTFKAESRWVTPFADVEENSYYFDAVRWAVENGVTSGTSATTFSPNNACTRAQAVTFLWHAADSPVVNYAMNFTDVPADAYYAEAVRWAVSQGITAGTSATTFSPDAPCTRAQIVTFLWRSAGSPAPVGTESFVDVPKDAYYAEAVRWAAENGITGGIGNNAFGPDLNCTRAQIVTFLWRHHKR